LEAFDSPRLPPLAIFGINLTIDWKNVKKALDTREELIVSKTLSDKIAVLKYYPVIPADVVRSMFNSKVDAIIIECYGVGNLPNNRPDVSAIIEETVKRGVLVVIITQCYKGIVTALYAVGKDLERLGVVSGFDMTLECTIAKLAYLLGKGLTGESLRTELQKDLKGELTPLKVEKFELKEESFIKAISDSINMNTDNEALRHALFPTIVCYSADFGYITSLQELKSQGANLQTGDYDGRTPLHIAARKGRLEIVKYLISEGVNLNAVDKSGKTALFEAVINQKYEVTKELVHAGGKIMAPADEISQYIMRLVFEGDLKDLRHAYYCGLKNLSDYKNFDGRTIGHLAASENRMDIIVFLKEETSFNFGLKDRWGKTPLDEAKHFNYVKIVEYLSLLPMKKHD